MLLDCCALITDTCEILLNLADQHRETSIAGYTHTRQAMPSTLGLLFAAHAEALLDDLPWLWTAFRHLNRSPLGSASGFGVALPLERQYVADLLAFDSLQSNTLAVQNDRGKSELLVLGSLLAPAQDLGRLAADLIWFSTDELGYLKLSEKVTTGSSIMPQKRNPDLLELVRASVGRLKALHAEVGAIMGGLSSGYHRDLQLTKEPFLTGLLCCRDMFVAISPALKTLTVDAERCRSAMHRSIGATDAVYRRVRTGEPFRTVYAEVAADPERAVAEDPGESWRERTHLGAPGSLDLLPYQKALSAERQKILESRERIQSAWQLFDLTT